MRKILTKKFWKKNSKKILRKNFEEDFDKKILIHIITRKIPRGVHATRVCLAWGARNTRVSRVRNPRNKCRKNFEENFDKKSGKKNWEKNLTKKFSLIKSREKSRVGCSKHACVSRGVIATRVRNPRNKS